MAAIEGSTRLKRAVGAAAWVELVRLHDEISCSSRG
jgi:hypothetical protein